MALYPKSIERASAILDAVKRAARQEQFLEVVSAEEARQRLEACIDRSPLGGETVELAAALGRALAGDVVAPVDAPPFDRSNVDGFAVRAADLAGASAGSPRRSSMEETDWHQLEEQRFAERVAVALQDVVRKRHVPAILVAAPPKTLAELRRAFHADVKAKIVAEIDKDLTKQPVDRIEAHLCK